MKKIQIGTASLVAAGLLVASCSATPGSDAADQESPEDVTILTDYLTFGRHAPFFVALDKGYFDEVGLNAEILPGRGANDVVTRLDAGQADLGFTSMSALINASAGSGGSGAKMVALMYQRNPEAVYYLSSSGIEEPADLVGKSVAMNSSTSIAQLFPSFLSAAGVEPTDVGTANVSPEALNAAVLTGRADAMLEFIFNDAVIKPEAEEAGLTVERMMYAEHGLALASNGFVAAHESLEGREDVVRRAVGALIKGYEYSLANPNEACEILNAHESGVEIDVCLAEQDILKELLLAEDGSPSVPLGTIDAAAVEETVKVLKEANPDLSGEVTFDELADPSFLP